MKKLTKNLLLSFSFFLIFISSCRKEEEIIQRNSESFQIESVKEWFNKKYSFINTRTVDDVNPKLPNWNKAKTYKFAFGEAVVVPIIYKKPYYPKYSVDNETAKKDKKEPKYKLTNNDLDYLLIRKDSKGVFQESVIRIIPDENYLIKSNGRKKQMAYDGLMIITDWQGKLVSGYKYINGKVKGSINPSKQARGVLDYICETTDWYSCASGDGGETWYCSYSYSETNCYDTGGNNEDYPDPNFNGGGNNDGNSGGGGGGPDEYQQAYNEWLSRTNAWASNEDLGEDVISDNGYSRVKNHRWKAVSNNTWYVYSLEESTSVLNHDPNTAQSQYWKFQKLDHKAIGTVGFLVDGTVTPTLENAIATVGNFSASMAISINITQTGTVAGHSFTRSDHYDPVKFINAN